MEGDLPAVLEIYDQFRGNLGRDEFITEWCWLLLECGWLVQARELVLSIQDPGQRHELEDLVSEEDPGGTSSPAPDPDGGPRDSDEVRADQGSLASVDPASPDSGPEDPLLDQDFLGPIIRQSVPDITASFLSWFGGRRDLYAKQWFDESRRRSGYHPIREPLTPAVAAAHLSGRVTVGQYVLFPDATVSFGVIDLDLARSSLADLRAASGDDGLVREHPSLRAYASRLLDGARRLGVPLWPEDSGGKGLHLWVFLTPRRPARAARTILGLILTQGGPQPPDVSVEIFPKQERPGSRGLSSLIKLPLGIHQATLRPCPLLDESLQPIEDPGRALARLEAVPDEQVGVLVGRRVLPLPPPELEPSEGPPPLPARSTARSLAEALREITDPAAGDRACERMLEGCAILRSFLRRGYEERHLPPGQARALVYTLGLIPSGFRLVSDVLAAAQVSRRELDRVARSLPSPTGCRKLRQLAPGVASECRCPDDKSSQPYATPAIFAVGSIPRSPPTWKPFSTWLETGDLETADPLATIGEWLRRIDDRLDRIEGRTSPEMRPEGSRVDAPGSSPGGPSRTDEDEANE